MSEELKLIGWREGMEMRTVEAAIAAENYLRVFGSIHQQVSKIKKAVDLAALSPPEMEAIKQKGQRIAKSLAQPF